MNDVCVLGDDVKEALKTGDGEWWMDWTDFVRYFTVLETCHVLRHCEGLTQHHDTWDEDVKFYLLTMTSDDEVFISLQQKDTRENRDELNREDTEADIGE